MRHFAKLFPAAVIASLLGAALAWASITGSISGVVTDQNGGVVVGAKVAAIETQTGVRSEITTDSKGFYNFPAWRLASTTLRRNHPASNSIGKADS